MSNPEPSYVSLTNPESNLVLEEADYVAEPTGLHAENDLDEDWRDELLPEPDDDMTVFTQVPTAKERVLATLEAMDELAEFFGIVDALQVEDFRAAQHQVNEKADWLIQSDNAMLVRQQIGKFLAYSDPEAFAALLAGRGYFDVIAQHFPVEVKQRFIPNILKYL